MRLIDAEATKKILEILLDDMDLEDPDYFDLGEASGINKAIAIIDAMPEMKGEKP